MGCGLNLSSSGLVQVPGSCEHSKKFSGSTEVEEVSSKLLSASQGGLPIPGIT